MPNPRHTGAPVTAGAFVYVLTQAPGTCTVRDMSTPTVIRVEDHEGDGTCSHCGREGIRWIVVLSDGSTMGQSCAKRALGVKITPANYNWLAHFTLVDTSRVAHADGTLTEYALYRSNKTGAAGRTTVNSHLQYHGTYEAAAKEFAGYIW